MAAEGLEEYAAVGGVALLRYLAALDPDVRERYASESIQGAIVASLPYDPRPHRPDSTGCGAEGTLSIGAFAAEHRYATLARLLGGVARRLAIATGMPAKSFRVAVNSRLPEKKLAVLAGLGWIGRSTLLVSHAYGPACVLGALFLPASFPLQCEGSIPGLPEDPRRAAALEPGALCGGCRACVDACPTGAIPEGNDGCSGIELELCIQYWASNPGDVPQAVRSVWGSRLYGCDECVAACPYAAAVWSCGKDGSSPAVRATALAVDGERRPGPRVPADLVRLAPDAEVRAYFRKTALGLSWLPPDVLRRNARLACDNPDQPFDGFELTD